MPALTIKCRRWSLAVWWKLIIGSSLLTLLCVVYLNVSPTREDSVAKPNFLFFSDHIQLHRSAFVTRHRQELGCHISRLLNAKVAADRASDRLIPKILHQTWPTRAVPNITGPWIGAWTHVNPNFTHMFWTNRAILNFILCKYPDFYALFMRYQSAIERSDVFRYFVLYEYGGVYADVDMEPVRDMTSLITSHHCLLPVEPDAHALLARRAFANAFRMLLSNAIMACRPRHPFFRFVIETLYRRTSVRQTLWRTGPAMLSRAMEEYLMIRGPALCRSRADRVSIVTSRRLLPTYDPSIAPNVTAICTSPEHGHGYQAFVVSIACRTSQAESTRPYTVHHWLHTWTQKGIIYRHNLNRTKFVNVQSVIPRAFFPYERRICSTKSRQTKYQRVP